MDTIAVLLPKHDLSQPNPALDRAMRLLLQVKHDIEQSSQGSLTVEIFKDEEAFEKQKNPAFNHPAFTTQSVEPPSGGWKS